MSVFRTCRLSLRLTVQDLVGSDGETHQGIFDLSYLSAIPNMCLMAPKNKWELADMLKYAIDYEGPIALRYPRGEAYDGCRSSVRRLYMANQSCSTTSVGLRWSQSAAW